MKLLIAALLAVFSTSVMAEWTMVGGGDTTTSYVDFSTIHKSDNKVKMWVLIGYKETRGFTLSDAQYQSVASQAVYDCEEETKKLLVGIFYSGSMGDGYVTSRIIMRDSESRYEPITPNSAEKIFFKVACSK